MLMQHLVAMYNGHGFLMVLIGFIYDRFKWCDIIVMYFMKSNIGGLCIVLCILDYYFADHFNEGKHCRVLVSH